MISRRASGARVRTHSEAEADTPTPAGSRLLLSAQALKNDGLVRLAGIENPALVPME